MKLTNEQINALSDDQVNEMMTACVLNMIDYDVSQSGKSLYSAEGRGLYTISVKDYCNDPAVMMPIAFENGISLIKEGDSDYYACFADRDGWELVTDDDFTDKKPCRAAAIVYLKSKGVL